MSNLRAFLRGVSDSRTRRKLTRIMDELVDDAEANKAVFDAHTHQGDGSQSACYNTSTPQSDAEDVSEETATTFTTTVTN